MCPSPLVATTVYIPCVCRVFIVYYSCNVKEVVSFLLLEQKCNFSENLDAKDLIKRWTEIVVESCEKQWLVPQGRSSCVVSMRLCMERYQVYFCYSTEKFDKNGAFYKLPFSFFSIITRCSYELNITDVLKFFLLIVYLETCWIYYLARFENKLYIGESNTCGCYFLWQEAVAFALNLRTTCGISDCNSTGKLKIDVPELSISEIYNTADIHQLCEKGISILILEFETRHSERRIFCYFCVVVMLYVVFFFFLVAWDITTFKAVYSV